MSFADAIRKGLDAEKRALEARCEQDELLKQASLEISSAVGLTVDLRYTSNSSARAAFTAERLDLDKIGSHRVDSLEIATEKRSLGVAEVEISEFGYPMFLRWGNENEMISNTREFSAGLERLLESRMMGEKVAWVVGATRAALKTQDS
jgi:hypothetical protein